MIDPTVTEPCPNRRSGRTTGDRERLAGEAIARGLLTVAAAMWVARLTRDLPSRSGADPTRSYNRIVRTGLAEINNTDHPGNLRPAFTRIENETDRLANRAAA